MSEFVDLTHPSTDIVDLAFSEAAPAAVKIQAAFFPFVLVQINNLRWGSCSVLSP